ncbi:hypothetical protein [Nocardioides ultimimeridianus]
MFNRTRHTDTARATSAIDAVLAELEAGAPAEEPAAQPDPDPQEAPEPAEAALDTVAGHTASLRATRDAQQQAQAMLTLAAQARSDATEQAEAILEEANAAAEKVRADAAAEAERLRTEALDWTVAQRERVQAAADRITADAEADAARHRDEAMQSAMAEAEQTARRYVGEAAARGARDAEEIRGQARDLLARAGGLGAEVQDALAQIATALEQSIASVRERLEQIDVLVGEVQGQAPAEPLEPAEPTEPVEPAVPISAEVRAALADDDVTDLPVQAPDAQTDEPDDEPDDDLGATDYGHPHRRQLGALFRDLDSAGA